MNEQRVMMKTTKRNPCIILSHLILLLIHVVLYHWNNSYVFTTALIMTETPTTMPTGTGTTMSTTALITGSTDGIGVTTARNMMIHGTSNNNKQQQQQREEY